MDESTSFCDHGTFFTAVLVVLSQKQSIGQIKIKKLRDSFLAKL
jgi:hypothetical protein